MFLQCKKYYYYIIVYFVLIDNEKMLNMCRYNALKQIKKILKMVNFIKTPAIK